MQHLGMGITKLMQNPLNVCEEMKWAVHFRRHTKTSPKLLSKFLFPQSISEECLMSKELTQTHTHTQIVIKDTLNRNFF